MYIRNDLTYKIWNDFCISDEDRDIVTIELLTKSMKNIIVSSCYKTPDGNWKNHCDHLQKILTNATMENKTYFLTGDFNLNYLEFYQSFEIRKLSNNMFEKEAIPLINRPTRVTTSSETLIDNISTNCVFDTSLKNGIIKTSISDQFAIFAVINISNEKTRNQEIKIKKRFFSDKNKERFKQNLQKINWEELNILNCTNTLYKHFINIYSSIYDKNFPLLETEVKLKDLRTPWMSKAMKKFSKQKQKLYIKFLKSKNPEDELICKNYKTLFEKLRKNSKQKYYSNLLEKHKDGRSWKKSQEKFRRKLNPYKQHLKWKTELYLIKMLLLKNSILFYSIFFPVDTHINHQDLTWKEFETTYEPLKRSKASGIDDRNSNIVLDFFEELKTYYFIFFEPR